MSVIMEIEIVDLEVKNIDKYSKVYCQLVNNNPTKLIIGETTAKPLTNIIKWNEKFINQDKFVKIIGFIVYMMSPLKGTLQLYAKDYILENNENNENNSPIELSENDNFKLRFTITQTHLNDLSSKNNFLNSTENIENFYFCVHTDKPHNFALVHVSNDQKVVQVSTCNFCNIPNIIFKKDENITSVLVNPKIVSRYWKYFFFVIQTESSSASLGFHNNSDFSMFASTTIENIQGNNLYIPVLLTMNSLTGNENKTNFNFSIEFIEKVLSDVKFENIYENALEEIIGYRDIHPSFLPNGVFNPETVKIPQTVDYLKVFFQHSNDEKIDLSFVIIKEDGSIGETCFFNKTSIAQNSIKLKQEKYLFYDLSAEIIFSKLPKNAKSIAIVLTSFYGQPLSKINKIILTFADKNENLITRMPINVHEDMPGFVVGFIEKNENGWEFKYLGNSCEYKVPTLAAKHACRQMNLEDEDVEWQEDE